MKCCTELCYILNKLSSGFFIACENFENIFHIVNIALKTLFKKNI